MKKVILQIVFIFKSLRFLYALKYLLVRMGMKLLRLKMNTYFSQTAEDVILEEYLPKKSDGFYVDVGCNDPYYLSNTFKLYLKGWSGITIDANRELIEKFKYSRKRDIPVCAAVSNEIKEVRFYNFKQDHYNTIEENIFEEVKKDLEFRNISIMQTRTLNDILNEHVDRGTEIDLLTIDVEGHDFYVLKSISLKIYSPKIIVIEIHQLNLNNIFENEIVNYLKEYNYKLIGYSTINAFFEKQ